MTTERPTAGEMQEMADSLTRWTGYGGNSGVVYYDDMAKFAHALRCAAEDAERAQEMREALSFYADPETYHILHDHGPGQKVARRFHAPIQDDQGICARTLLGGDR